MSNDDAIQLIDRSTGFRGAEVAENPLEELIIRVVLVRVYPWRLIWLARLSMFAFPSRIFRWRLNLSDGAPIDKPVAYPQGEQAIFGIKMVYVRGSKGDL